MINYRITFDTDDADMALETLSISFPVRLTVGDEICFDGIEKTDLSDEFIFSLMGMINKSHKALSYDGEVESKEDVIDFLKYAVWEVTDVKICPKELCICVELR